MLLGASQYIYPVFVSLHQLHLKDHHTLANGSFCNVCRSILELSKYLNDTPTFSWPIIATKCRKLYLVCHAQTVSNYIRLGPTSALRALCKQYSFRRRNRSPFCCLPIFRHTCRPERGCARNRCKIHETFIRSNGWQSSLSLRGRANGHEPA